MIDESSLMAMQMAAIQCIQEEMSTLRAERDALRKVDDAMVERFLRAYAEYESKRQHTFTHRLGVRTALTAALASVAPSATDVLFPGAA